MVNLDLYIVTVVDLLRTTQREDLVLHMVTSLIGEKTVHTISIGIKRNTKMVDPK